MEKSTDRDKEANALLMTLLNVMKFDILWNIPELFPNLGRLGVRTNLMIGDWYVGPLQTKSRLGIGIILALKRHHIGTL